MHLSHSGCRIGLTKRLLFRAVPSASPHPIPNAGVRGSDGDGAPAPGAGGSARG